VHLLLDSSGAELVCALADAEGVIAENRLPSGSGEARDISAVAGPLLGEKLPRDLDGIVAGLGPGSFIGTRVALSFANGLGATGDVPLLGVNSLAATGTVYGGGRGVVMRDARRGEVYCYGPAGHEPECRLLALDDLETELGRLMIGSVVIEQPSPHYPNAAQVLRTIMAAAAAAGAVTVECSGVPAEGLRRAGQAAQPVDYLEPVYLRGFL